MPATTSPPSPAAWSLRPKYLGLGRAWTDWTGTTNRMPSTEATSPPPHACARPMDAWCAISVAFAAR